MKKNHPGYLKLNIYFKAYLWNTNDIRNERQRFEASKIVIIFKEKSFREI